MTDVPLANRYEEQRGIRTLMASVGHAIGKRVGSEQAQLNLDRRDGVHSVGAADGVGTDLAEADAANPCPP